MITYYFILLFVLVCPVINAKNALETKFIDLPLDHFDVIKNKTFKLRYLVNKYFHVKGGPIFFYAGNEGDIHMFAKNTGFLFDIAPVFNAMIVFAEHRYYGESLPFRNISFSSAEQLRYLSTMQVLNDFVYLIEDLKINYLKGMTSKDTHPFVAFGGSYGGMLAAWLRMKYPHVVVGAVASSAPIWLFDDITSCDKFYGIVTDVFKKFGTAECPNIIKKSWVYIRNITKSNKGREHLSHAWSLCKPVRTPEDVEVLVDWLSDIYVNLAMYNYNYPTEFEMRLPAYPVKVFCDKLISLKQNGTDEGLLEAMSSALEVYTNYSGRNKCNNINVTSDNPTDFAWRYQTCSEFVMPICSTPKDMFETRPWDLNKYADWCQKTFGIHIRNPQWTILEYGGRNLKYFSNIVFSNGLVDPWSCGGVLKNVSETIWAVNITDGPHHLDLRKADGADTNYVIEARKFHVRAIKKWLKIT